MKIDWKLVGAGTLVPLTILATANLSDALTAWGWNKWLGTYAPLLAPVLLHPLVSLVVVAGAAFVLGLATRPALEKRSGKSVTAPADPGLEAFKLGSQMDGLRRMPTGNRPHEFLAQFRALGARAERLGLKQWGIVGGADPSDDGRVSYAKSYMRDVAPLLLQRDLDGARRVAAETAASTHEHMGL